MCFAFMKKITSARPISQARRNEYNDIPHNQAWNIQGQTGSRE
jgi:hypothetical protein